MSLNTKVSIVVFSTLVLSNNAHAKARCSQFETQAKAQAYMYSHGAYYLDRDRDGEACECLPGGSKHGDSICSYN